MKIGIAGAGAVGSYFGGQLAKAGNDVTFLARGEHLAAMKQSGLDIITSEGTDNIKATFTDNIADLAEVELILLAVKSNDTEEVAKALKEYISTDTLVLTMQNGVDNEHVLMNILNSNPTLSSATYVQAEKVDNGKIKQTGRVKLVIGELTADGKERCLQVIEMFQKANVDTSYAENILANKWKKYLWNATFNPLSAAMSVLVGDILDDENLNKIAKDVCNEVIDVARALNLPIDREKTLETVFANAEFARNHQTSMLQDRLNGRKMEIESMCGYVVKQGEQLNVSTPVLATIYRMLNFIDR